MNLFGEIFNNWPNQLFRINVYKTLWIFSDTHYWRYCNELTNITSGTAKCDIFQHFYL